MFGKPGPGRLILLLLPILVIMLFFSVSATTALAGVGTPEKTPTNTPAKTTVTKTPTNTPTKTPVPPTSTPTNTPTKTPVPPTNTPTNTPTKTPVPPTNTPTNTPTKTPVPPTNTPTSTPTKTPVPPTKTPEPTPTKPAGGEGCTPGYWRQEHHFDSWVGYLPTDGFDTVFGVVSSFGPHATLFDVVNIGGGGESAMGRHAVAALLNAASDVDYAYSVANVISMVQGAYASGDFEGTKNLFEAQNEAGCPLN